MDRSYQLIGPLFRAYTKTNFGTWTDLVTDGEDHFVGCFLALAAWIRASDHCRRMIALDACHLRGHCKGEILAATSTDGNGQLVPIAIGIAGIENAENWRWFVQNLVAALPVLQYDVSDFVIISDREKVRKLPQKVILFAKLVLIHSSHRASIMPHKYFFQKHTMYAVSSTLRKTSKYATK